MSIPWWLWALGGGIVIGGVAYSLRKTSTNNGAASGITPVQSGDIVVLVGDSLGVGLAKPLASMLKQLGVTLVSSDGGSPLVITGKTAKGLLPVVQAHQQVLAGASTVLVSLGSNDAAMGDPTTESTAVKDLLALLGGDHRQVIWLVPPSYGLADNAVPAPATQKKQDAFSSMMVGLPEVFPSDGVMSELSSVDRIHLTPKGYGLFAAQIANAVTGASGA